MAFSKRTQQSIALSLLALMLLGLWYAVLRPVVTFAQEGWQEHRRSVARLEQLKGLIARYDDLKAAQLKLADDPGWSRLYLSESAGTATALVQGDVQALAQSVGISIDSMQPLAERPNGPLSYVGARVSIAVTLDVLLNLATRMNTAQRALIIDDFSIIAPQAQTGEANPVLGVQMDVYGVWRKQP